MISERLEPCEVSVVIPTLGKSPHLRGLLERLQRQTVSFRFEVLVVANIPSQCLRETVMSYGSNPRIKFEYLETGRIGVSLARNRGLDRSRGSIVLFLDDDAILDNDRLLEMHLARHRQNECATAVGGPYSLAPQANPWDRTYHTVAHDWLHRQRMSPSGNQTRHLLGGNMSFKRHHLLEHNWQFDEVITFGGAESGLCQRITSANGTLLYFEDLAIGHAPHLGIFSFCRKAFLQGAGARWRDGNLPPPTLVFINEYAPIKTERNRFRHGLYRLCFDFGFSVDAFNRPKPGRPPALSYFGLLCFLLRKISARRALRKKIRSFYAALRSAWLNVRHSEKSENEKYG